MKIILHGATNGSNFGDYLFADIFWHTLLSCNKDGKTLFFEFPRYGFGRFFRKELGYTHKQTIGDVFNGDMLVYFSGGYFGQRTSSLKESIKRLIRYMPIGIVFALRRKPILMLGVGGGPITNKLLRSAICWLMNRAAIVTVRDEETANYFKSYGVKKEIKVTSDTAQVITPDSLPPLDDAVKESIKKKFCGQENYFFTCFGGGSRRQIVLRKDYPAAE
ncbi:MAG: polysaccharide pyruvyl transferase family protein [Firmicutes bacterium]|nr:polysaccharide pyruvyl transferase family protein [Bacillota bacterium]